MITNPNPTLNQWRKPRSHSDVPGCYSAPAPRSRRPTPRRLPHLNHKDLSPTPPPMPVHRCQELLLGRASRASRTRYRTTLRQQPRDPPRLFRRR